MDVTEALLFQHINTVINSLNTFTDKNNITSLHVLHRLDYLYERLSDFLGRELDNGWWSVNDQAESQLTHFESPQQLIQSTPKSSPAQYEYVETEKSTRLVPFNFESPENAATTSSSIESLHFDSPKTTKVLENTKKRAVNSEVEKNGFSQSSIIESANSELPEHIRASEIQLRPNGSAAPTNLKLSKNIQINENITPVLHQVEPANQTEDKPTTIQYKCGVCNEQIEIFNSDHTLSVSLHVQGEVHQRAMKQKTKKSSVYIEAKRHVAEKARLDLGRYVIEKITTSYFCKVCNVNILDNVRRHVSESSHQNNMREKDVDSEETEAISEKHVTTFHCALCSVDTSGVKNLEDHMVGQCHVKKMLEGISDENIKLNKKGLYLCKLCSVSVSSKVNVADHVNGKLHKKKLVEKENEKILLESDTRVGAEFIHFNDITMICKVCNVYILKANLKDHISTKSHSENLSMHTYSNWGMVEGSVTK